MICSNVILKSLQFFFTSTGSSRSSGHFDHFDTQLKFGNCEQEDLVNFRQRLAAKGVALMVDFVLPGSGKLLGFRHLITQDGL